MRPNVSMNVAGRVLSLARAEAILLRRNPIALLTALVLPAAAAAFLQSVIPEGAVPEGGTIVLSLTGLSLLFAVYYNLVTVLVARREELVLKRMRSGECSDAEVLIGAAVPAVAIAWVQVIIGLAVAIAAFGIGMPVNPVLIVTAVVSGTAVFVLLAAVSTAMTRTVELAQISTMPVLVVSFAFSGLMFPLDILPEPAQWAAQGLPLTQVINLMQLGLTGNTPEVGTHAGEVLGLWASFGAALPALLVLAAWFAAGVLAWRRFMRWEPRR